MNLKPNNSLRLCAGSSWVLNANKLDFLNEVLGLLENPHAIATMCVNRTRGEKEKDSPTSEISDDILYIKIPTFSATNLDEDLKRGQELIDVCLKNRDKYKGIIFDVRGIGTLY